MADLTWNQAQDVLRFYRGVGHRLHRSPGVRAVFDRTQLIAWVLESECGGKWDGLLMSVNAWPREERNKNAG
jgi:hypothetical protein